MNKSFVIAIAAVGAVVLVTTFSSAETVSPDMVMIKDGAFAKSLTGSAGDAAKGKITFANRKLGNCLACHVNKDMADKPFHGEIGPPLDGVAGRYDENQLRAILINSKMVLGEDTMMPSFYRLKNGVRTLKKFQGKTILNAQQVEDVLAYLKTLK
jgi:sulfur-oxidizing protein SoxX